MTRLPKREAQRSACMRLLARNKILEHAEPKQETIKHPCDIRHGGC
jgi:hypothetical protein